MACAFGVWKGCTQAKLAHTTEAYPSFCSMKPTWNIAGMLVHRRSPTHLYSRVERGTVLVKCPAQEHNTITPARAPTQTAWSRVQRANH